MAHARILSLGAVATEPGRSIVLYGAPVAGDGSGTVLAFSWAFVLREAEANARALASTEGPRVRAPIALGIASEGGQS